MLRCEISQIGIDPWNLRRIPIKHTTLLRLIDTFIYCYYYLCRQLNINEGQDADMP